MPHLSRLDLRCEHLAHLDNKRFSLHLYGCVDSFLESSNPDLFNQESRVLFGRVFIHTDSCVVLSIVDNQPLCESLQKNRLGGRYI